MDEHDFKEVVRVMESVEGFKFPENEQSSVAHPWGDTFSGLSLLMRQHK